MIILPTRGRPENIKRFIRQYHETQASEPLTLVIDHNDRSYDALELPPQFSVKTMGPHGGITECVNAVFADRPNEAYYGIMADDVVPQSLHWDRLLADACRPAAIAWGDDDQQDIGLPTHPFLGGDLVRALGWVVYPKVKHWYADNVVLDLADGLGIGKPMMEVKTPHYHVLNAKADLDDTYLSQPSREKDRLAYEAFKEKELPALIASVKAKLNR
jgi:hypothetical protein